MNYMTLTWKRSEQTFERTREHTFSRMQFRLEQCNAKHCNTVKYGRAFQDSKPHISVVQTVLDRVVQCNSRVSDPWPAMFSFPSTSLKQPVFNPSCSELPELHKALRRGADLAPIKKIWNIVESQLFESLLQCVIHQNNNFQDWFCKKKFP